MIPRAARSGPLQIHARASAAGFQAHRKLPGRAWMGLQLRRTLAESRLKARRAAISVTPAAAARIKELLSARTEPALGIKLGVRQRGCNGLTYTMDYCVEKEKLQEVVEEHDVKVFIEPKALMFLIGTTMDFVGTNVCSRIFPVIRLRIKWPTSLASVFISIATGCHCRLLTQRDLRRRPFAVRVCICESKCQRRVRLWRVVQCVNHLHCGS
eukprot:SAG31_NODE_509_length_14732_cov_13.043600_3_plen_212_part_00